MRYLLTSLAEADLLEVWEFIARDDPDAADRVVDEIRAALDRLAEMPRIGRARPELADVPLRSWPVRSYLIVYRPDVSPLLVVRIVSGFRDLDTLL